MTKGMEDLVDRIVASAFGEESLTIKTLVGHEFPDDDVWLCFWLAKRFIPRAVDAEIAFVKAGERLPDSEGDPGVLHFDTGGGDFDQHDQPYRRTCSAALLAEKMGLLQEHPGINPLIEMVTAVDNVEALPATSLHYVIEGLPRSNVCRNGDGSVDWSLVQDLVFMFFDTIYKQEEQRVKSRLELSRHCTWRSCENGLKVAILFWHPELREAAFEQGAAVVIWTQHRPKNRFYTAVQVSRNYSRLNLGGAVAALRAAEARVRKIDIADRNLSYFGRGEPVSQWFLHNSNHLILNGSRSWRLEEDDYTLLGTGEIVNCVHQALKAIPKSVVGQMK